MAVASMDHCGIDAVLKDMRQLAQNADNAVKIGAGGGVEAIVQAMGGHCGNEGGRTSPPTTQTTR
jgi:hypothetical protein